MRTGDRTFIGQNASTLIKRRPPTAFARGVQRVSFLLIGFMLAMVPIVVTINGWVTKDWVQVRSFGFPVLKQNVCLYTTGGSAWRCCRCWVDT